MPAREKHGENFREKNGYEHRFILFQSCWWPMSSLRFFFALHILTSFIKFQHSSVTARIRFSLILSHLHRFDLYEFQISRFLPFSWKKKTLEKIKTVCFISMLTNGALTSYEVDNSNHSNNEKKTLSIKHVKSWILYLVIKITLTRSTEQTRKIVMGNKSISNHKIYYWNWK